MRRHIIKYTEVQAMQKVAVTAILESRMHFSWDPISPVVEGEWRGHITIEALRTLDAYERENIN